MEKKSFTFDEIKLKLVNYCVYQDRCHQEVEQKMRDFTLIPEAKDALFLYLIRENYLNEERFARSYARGKFYIKRWGKNKIRQHLKQKGITEKLITKSFEEIDEKDYRDTLKKTFQDHFTAQKGLKDYQKKIKSIRYTLSRGYEYEEILNIIDNG